MEITKPVSQGILQRIKEKFSDEDQLMFFESFKLYLQYDSEKDFVVSLDDVYKWIGFTRKDNAKRLLEAKFKVGADYEIAILRMEDRKNPKPKETLLMTVDCFKRLCLKADTKKADQIQILYVKMEKLLFQLLIEEQQSIVRRKDVQLKKQQEEIQSLKATQSNYEEVEKEGHVYILSTDKQAVFKVGRSKHPKKRVSQLQTALVDEIKILYDFECSNDVLLESIVHYVLERYRCNSNREHFAAPIEYIKEVIRLAGCGIDTLKSTYHSINKEELRERLKEKIDKEITEENEGYQIERLVSFHIEEITGSNIFQPVDIPSEKTFFQFLKEKAMFRLDATTDLSSIRDGFSLWKGLPVRKLEKDAFLQVDNRFIIKKIKICKSCKNNHLVGCCSNYGRTNRTSKDVVSNLILIS